MPANDEAPKADVKTLMLRLPSDLHSRLVALAERERRSLNNQIVYMLERLLAQQAKDDQAQEE